MKRKTFKKMLMSFGVPRNDAERLSRNNDALMYRRNSPGSICAALVRYIMQGTELTEKGCEDYAGYAYMREAAHLKVPHSMTTILDVVYTASFLAIQDLLGMKPVYYADNKVVLDATKFPDLAMCVNRLHQLIDYNGSKILC